MSRLSKPQRVPLLCYVTDLRAISSRESGDARATLLEKVAAAAAAGVDWIQIREKHLPAKECTALVREALQHVAHAACGNASDAPGSRASPLAPAKEPARVLVNDRLDVALAALAGGVHLAQNGLPPQEVKRLVRERGLEQDFLVGVSCHSLEAAKTAEQGGADYLLFGPVFVTPSKAAYGAPQGLERLAEVCRGVSVPVLAIGGITLENCSACLTAGAAGFAAIRLFQDAADLPALVQSLRKTAG